jgi:hypothetical protein
VRRGVGYGVVYTGNSNGRNTFPERAPRKTAERPGELFFNVRWSYVKGIEFSVNRISVRLSLILYHLESTTTADYARKVKQGTSNQQDRLEQQLDSLIYKNKPLVFCSVDETSTSATLTTCSISIRTPTTALTQPSSCLDRSQKRKQEQKQKHTTAGIRQWSPT